MTTDQPSAVAAAQEPSAVLEARGLLVRFGALTAVNQVDVNVQPRQVVGIIGPNGAGKSTCLGAISGLVPLANGTVRLQGTDVTRLSQHKRARRGLGRTFQNLEVFTSLSVLDNLLLAIQYADTTPHQLWPPRRTRGRANDHVERALDALESVGIGDLAQVEAGRLAYAQRKLVEFARALAADVRLLLLDEPVAGIAVEERRALIEVVKRQLTSRQIAAVVVEHDMNVIQSLCDYVYVMDSGSVIAQGVWQDVVSDPHVRTAYLGQ